MSGNLLRTPFLYFALQVAGLTILLAAFGWFSPVPVGDTLSYDQYPFQSLAEAFDHPRTFGYPVFLQIGRLLGPSHRAIPLLGFIIHILAVYVFWLGLKRVFRSEWTSMVTASSLLYSNVLVRYGNNLAADGLASSLAIATIGWLLLTLFNDRRRSYHWWLLALLVFAAYQVRPAYLFLIPLLPLLGLSTYWLLMPTQTQRRVWWSLGANLTLIVALPYLAYCGLRWTETGRFTLVSFGGNNFAAITCMYLSEDDVKNLPEEIQPLADAVMDRQKEVAERDPSYTAGPTRRYMEIEAPFDVNICEICVPAAREARGDRWPEINDALWRLATEIVSTKPTFYAVWLAKAFIRGVYMVVSEYVMNPVYFLATAALTVAHALSVILRKRTGQISPAADPTFFIEINLLWTLALSFALASILLVILTSPALGRFMDASGVFFACVLARVLVNRIELCWHLARP